MRKLLALSVLVFLVALFAVPAFAFEPINGKRTVAVDSEAIAFPAAAEVKILHGGYDDDDAVFTGDRTDTDTCEAELYGSVYYKGDEETSATTITIDGTAGTITGVASQSVVKLTVTGDLDATDTLTVTGATTLGTATITTATVTGVTTLQGDVNATDTLTVTGNTILGTVTATTATLTNVGVSGVTTLSGDVNATDTVTVTGAAIFGAASIDALTVVTSAGLPANSISGTELTDSAALRYLVVNTEFDTANATTSETFPVLVVRDGNITILSVDFMYDKDISAESYIFSLKIASGAYIVDPTAATAGSGINRDYQGGYAAFALPVVSGAVTVDNVIVASIGSATTVGGSQSVWKNAKVQIRYKIED